MPVSLVKNPDMRLGGADPIDIMQLGKNTCRWPVKDAAAVNSPWAFCGHTVHKGSYCRKHGAMAYRGTVSKKDS